MGHPLAQQHPVNLARARARKFGDELDDVGPLLRRQAGAQCVVHAGGRQALGLDPGDDKVAAVRLVIDHSALGDGGDGPTHRLRRLIIR